MNPRRILFVDGLWVEKFGIMSLVPSLQQAGWEVDWLLTRNTRRLLRTVARTRPALVAFSVTTGYHHKALAMAGALKAAAPEIQTLFGGPHVTYFPEIAADPRVDIAVRGECDLILPEILAQLADKAPRTTIPNLVSATEEGLQFGPLAPLVEDLDSLPFPDRELLYRYRLFRTSPYKAFMVSRGCPYDCAFCFNHKLREMYRGKGRFLRLRSPASIIEEARRVRDRWGMKLASFEDDLLTYDKQWLAELLTRWRSELNIPYNLNATAASLNDESLVRLLKETGIWCVAFGVETGDETLRRKLLHKPLTDDQIRTAGRLLNKHGIRFLTYNMFALPGETLDDARRTLALNRDIRTPLARYTLFQPYPGTQLGDSVLADGAQHEMLYHNLGHATPEAARIARLQKYAMVGIRSAWGERLALAASRIPADPIHNAVFWATYFNVVRRYMRTGYPHLLELGLRSLTNLF